MKIKISEATHTQLDWLVAKCLSIEVFAFADRHKAGNGYVLFADSIERIGTSEKYSPTTDWAQGGPIIEQEGICTAKLTKTYWIASPNMESSDDISGPTPLIAAMRCYAVSRLGEYVEMPDELI